MRPTGQGLGSEVQLPLEFFAVVRAEGGRFWNFARQGAPIAEVVDAPRVRVVDGFDGCDAFCVDGFLICGGHFWMKC